MPWYLNFGYQGIMSCIDALVNRRDVIVYDGEAHACLVDGIRLHMGYSYKYKHNDVEDCEKQLATCCKKWQKKMVVEFY